MPRKIQTISIFEFLPAECAFESTTLREQLVLKKYLEVSDVPLIATISSPTARLPWRSILPPGSIPWTTSLPSLSQGTTWIPSGPFSFGIKISSVATTGSDSAGTTSRKHGLRGFSGLFPEAPRGSRLRMTLSELFESKLSESMASLSSLKL